MYNVGDKVLHFENGNASECTISKVTIIDDKNVVYDIDQEYRGYIIRGKNISDAHLAPCKEE